MKNLLFCLLLVIVFSGNAQTTAPQRGEGSLYTISTQNLRMAVDTANGARISSFQVSESELLYVDFSNNNMAGSTFWPSPQSVWNWPPLVNLDSKPYQADIKGNRLIVAGNTDSKTNLRFYKIFQGNAADTSIVIDYVMKNEKSTSQKWAPWEVTRVAGNGVTLYEKGDVAPTGILEPFTEEIDGMIWYDQDKNKITQSGTFKFIGDGKGWIAHVVGGKYLLLKQFENIAQADAAPFEGEIEVYTARNSTYTEVENQGAYVSIASKDSVTWRVKWYARQLPANVDAKVGSASLVNYIHGILSRSVSPVSYNTIEKEKVKVYPNPANDFLMIDFNGVELCDARMAVYSMQGSKVIDQPISQSRKPVSVGNLSKGVYLYEILQGRSAVANGRFAIERQ